MVKTFPQKLDFPNKKSKISPRTKVKKKYQKKIPKKKFSNKKKEIKSSNKIKIPYKSNKNQEFKLSMKQFWGIWFTGQFLSMIIFGNFF